MPTDVCHVSANDFPIWTRRGTAVEGDTMREEEEEEEAEARSSTLPRCRRPLPFAGGLIHPSDMLSGVNFPRIYWRFARR